MEKRSEHIAFYIGSLNKGGAERVFINLAKYFSEKGYRVTMVTQYQAKEEFELPQGVNRVLSDLTPEEEGGRIANFVNRYRKLRRIFKELKADVVLSTIGKNNFMAIMANLFCKTRVVVSVVAEPTLEYIGPFMQLLAKTLFYLADGIVFQTTDAARFFQKGLRKKSVILKNSLNPQFMRPRFEEERQQDIVVVGRMDDNKNHKMVIDAFAKVADRYPDSRLIFYGKGELLEFLKQRALAAGLKDRILFPGQVTDVADCIEKAYLFVLSSYLEGMPNTLIEAMALGLACISTDCPCGGPRDLIKDGVNGFLIPVGDTQALADRMELLLGDRQKTQELGRAAALLQNQYCPDKVNAEWEAYLLHGIKPKGQALESL